MIFTNPLEAPQTVGMSKPSSIRLIEAIPSQPSQPKIPQKKGPPPIEAFPALGRPAPATPGGANWSKAMASKPTPKANTKSTAAGGGGPPKPKAAPAIDLKDGGSFPTLLGGGSSRPGGLGPAPPGRWANGASSSSAAGSSKNKKRNKALAVEGNEWMRPNGDAANTTAHSEDSLSDPYITHHANNERNNALRGKVRHQLMARSKENKEDASESFASFKELSLSYRNGEATADAFFEIGRDLLGPDFFDAIIADLISLLPSIAKQNELYRRLMLDERLKNSRSATLWQCTECSQLVIPAEKAEHQRCHTKSGR